MESLVKWAVENGPGVNVMVMGVIVAGGLSFMMLRRETFPEFELEVVLVQVPYPGHHRQMLKREFANPSKKQFVRSTE